MSLETSHVLYAVLSFLTLLACAATSLHTNAHAPSRAPVPASLSSSDLDAYAHSSMPPPHPHGHALAEFVLIFFRSKLNTLVGAAAVCRMAPCLCNAVVGKNALWIGAACVYECMRVLSRGHWCDSMLLCCVAVSCAVSSGCM